MHITPSCQLSGQCVNAINQSFSAVTMQHFKHTNKTCRMTKTWWSIILCPNISLLTGALDVGHKILGKKRSSPDFIAKKWNVAFWLENYVCSCDLWGTALLSTPKARYGSLSACSLKPTWPAISICSYSLFLSTAVSGVYRIRSGVSHSFSSFCLGNTASQTTSLGCGTAKDKR